MSTPAVALTIAGSDSSGGAGLQADLRCFAALGVHGACAVTAVTAQDSVGIRAIHPISPDTLDAQIAAVVQDLAPRAVKTGMLANLGVMEVVARHAAAGSFPLLVVDPVMTASTGTALLAADARAAYLELLFPWANVVTPNLEETELLLGRPVTSLADMEDAARALRRAGPHIVVVKGGHLTGDTATDVVFDGLGIIRLGAARIATANLHGTGCTFSAAVAANLARGMDALPAVTSAKRYVTSAIQGAVGWALGRGPGPLDHLGWSGRSGWSGA